MTSKLRERRKNLIRQKKKKHRLQRAADVSYRANGHRRHAVQKDKAGFPHVLALDAAMGQACKRGKDLGGNELRSREEKKAWQ